MATEQKYNGWTNYATWRVNLEIVDDYIASLGDGELEFPGLSNFADHLQEICEEVVTNYGEADEESLLTHYARAFLGQVDWYEIARAHAEDNPDTIRITGR